MATEFKYFQGKAKWVRVNQPDQWDKWKITLYPDAESLEAIRELQAEGAKNVIKKDEDGYFTNFSRPTQKVIRGKVIGFTAPTVILKNGDPIPPGTQVGNGSDVTIKVEVYSHGTPGGGKAKAARLESIRVDNLVPFTADNSFNPQEKEQVAGLTDQPEQLF